MIYLHLYNIKYTFMLYSNYRTKRKRVHSMKDLQKHFDKCLAMVESKNIQPDRITSVKAQKMSPWGKCKCQPNGYSILINSILLDDSLDDSALDNTIIHEILHTVDGCFNHGKKWKICAEIINRAYGLNVKRGSSFEDKGIDHTEDIRYIVKCEKCGYEFKRRRLSNLIKYPELYRCECGGNLKRVK